MHRETEARLSLNIWTPPGSNNAPPAIRQAGELWMGRFGFFIPRRSSRTVDSDTQISYTILQDSRTDAFKQFLLDSRTLNDIKSLAE